MASAFGHAILGFTISKIGKTNSKLLIVLSIVSAAIPDLDVILHYNGVAYSSMWGHRGFTHSFFFAALWAGTLILTFKSIRQFSSFLVLFFSTVSHGLVDAMTTGGKGIAWLAPFSSERFFMPDFMRVIRVSPMSIRRFIEDTDWAYRVLSSEFIWIFIPCIIILIVLKFIKWK